MTNANPDHLRREHDDDGRRATLAPGGAGVCRLRPAMQQSVFECSLTLAQMEQLRDRLLGEIDPSLDSLRIYRLPEAVEMIREIHGVFQDIDFTGPLVL